MLLAQQHRDDLDGYLIGHGSPLALDDLPVQRLCSYVWWFITRNAEDKDREDFRIKVWRPPPQSTAPIPKDSPWSAENETKAFSSLKSALNA